MASYLFKVILCSIFFLFFYKALFEKGKTCRFNRYYLIAALILPFIIPLLSLPEYNLQSKISEPVLFIPSLQDTFADIPSAVVTNFQGSAQVINSWNFFLPITYFLVTSTLLIRFIIYLNVFRKSVVTSEFQKRGNAKLVFTDGIFTPHTFLHYIFVPRNQPLPEDILSHEITHVKQWHTLDILFAELLQVFFWFNPALPFYRKAIKLNHEYLADESAVNSGIDREEYLYTLLTVCENNSNLILSHNFNKCSTIKKRIKMIMKNNSKTGQLLRIMAVVPAFALSLFLFTGNNFAQTAGAGQTTASQKQGESSAIQQNSKIESLLKDSIFAAKYKEYNQIIDNRMEVKNGKKFLNLRSFSKEEISRMKALHLSMTPEQQSVMQLVAVKMKAPTNKIPTEKEFESWKDASVYGIWLDNKRIENSQLNNYRHSDFSFYTVSKLAKNAKNYGNHVYQLNLYTSSYHNEWKAQWDADETLHLMPNVTKR